MINRIFIVFVFILSSSFIKAENDALDSLLQIAKTSKDDSVLLSVYNRIGSLSNREDETLSKEYWGKALKLAEEKVAKNSTPFYLEELATAYNGMGIINTRTGNLPEAIAFYQKSVNINEELKNLDKMSANYFNIGVIYRNIKEYDKSLEYYNKSLKLREELNDTTEVARSYLAIGVIYRRMDDYEKARACYQKSLDIAELSNDEEIASHAYSNIGVINIQTENYEEALKYFNKAFEFTKTQNSQSNIAKHHANLCSVYEGLGNVNKAIEEGELAYQMYIEMNRYPDLSSVASKLSELYLKKSNYKRAHELYKKHIVIRDSIFNETTTREITEKEMQFEFDKQMLADSLARAEEAKIRDLQYQQKLNQQKTYTYGGAIILLIVIVFSAMLYKRLKVSNKQKTIIEEQKLIVEVKNREIVDSINYAKRIQRAILPPVETIRESLPDTFVFYQPKDIVAGDFYWFSKRGNKVFLAVADCTGHGVPGAMVSVVCTNALYRSVNGFKLEKPAEILDKTAELVVEAFKTKNEEVKDGMDISLCCFDMDNKVLEYAGAINSLYYVRDNELNEVKGDKQPIGQYGTIKPFTNHQLDLKEGDKIYMFSDGFADQFGGEKGKKYMYRRFRDLIYMVSNKEFANQQQAFASEFETWKGDLEQLDDVCIIGVKV